jgi:hypothetical protein
MALALVVCATPVQAIKQPPVAPPAKADVPMPPAVVLIVCKTVESGEPDQNAQFTKHQNREWATPNAMMYCRRQEVAMVDMAAEQGADPQPFNMHRCMMSAMMLGSLWDQQHPSSAYRFWRVACPVPIINESDGRIIAWKMPDCGHRETVVCEVDTAI